jgi:hypothetical protein
MFIFIFNMGWDIHIFITGLHLFVWLKLYSWFLKYWALKWILYTVGCTSQTCSVNCIKTVYNIQITHIPLFMWDLRLTVLLMNSPISWVMTPCRLVHRYQSDVFRELSVSYYGYTECVGSMLIQDTIVSLHGIISQNTGISFNVIDIFTCIKCRTKNV